MFCRHCGTQLPDGSASCSSCGADLTAPRVQPTVSTVPPASPQPAAAGTGTATSVAGLPLRLIAKIGLIIALLSFFLPFVTVSCSGGGSMLSETYTGVQLMTTIGSGDDELLKESKSDAKANFFVWMAFLSTAAGAAVLFTQRKSKIAGITSACGAFFLLIFSASFRSYYGISGSDYEKYVDVDIRFGLVFCMLFLIGSAVLCFLDRSAPGAKNGSNGPNAITSLLNSIAAAANAPSQPPAGSPPAAPPASPAPVAPTEPQAPAETSTDATPADNPPTDGQ